MVVKLGLEPDKLPPSWLLLPVYVTIRHWLFSIMKYIPNCYTYLAFLETKVKENVELGH